MNYDWILDVLADLREFARENGLHALAENLNDTAIIAAAEFASRNGAEAVEANEQGTGRSYRATTKC